MSQYNVALKVNYNGKSVSTGAAANARDLGKVRSATAEQGRVSAATAKQNQTLSNSYRAMAGAVSLYASVRAGLGLVTDVKNSELLSIRIKNLTNSFEENAEAQEYLAATADRLNVRYSTLADGYGKFLALQKAGVQTSSESRSILEGLTNAAKELGATNESVAQTIFGYSQAATQGVVQSTELLQVTEPLPGLLQNIDRAAGLASGGFKKLVGEGKVTSDYFKQVLIKALQAYEGAAASTSETIDAAQQDFLTTYDVVLKKLQSPVNAAIVPVITTAKDALVLLSDNVDVLGDVATGAVVLSAVLAGKLAGSLATSTSAFVQNRVAAQAKLVADKAVAASTLTAAKTQAAYAVQLQQGAQRQLFAAKSDAARSTAITNLALRNGQLLTAQNAVTAATVRYTAAARTASVASRALSGSMAFLGGPIGIITTAAIAVSFFSSAANDAEVPTDELTASVKGLTDGYKQLTQTQLKARGVRLDDQLNTVNERVSAITANIANLRTEARDGIRISVGVQAPVSAARKKEINDDILLQEAELERLEQSKNTLLETQLEIKERIASGSGPDNAPDAQSAGLVTPEVDYSKQLAKLDVSLQTEKERVQASFDAKEKILIESLDRNLLTQNAFDVRHMQIQLERDTALREIKQDAEKEQLELSRERREKELRDIEERYEQELRLLQGFASRKEQVEFELEERVFAFKTRKTGQMQGVLGNFSNWQKRDEADKVNAVVGLGEFGFKQFAGQSKKAFAAYKAFSIAKAVINTYEMATGAFNALAPIPVVGPILGAAAAASAVAFGLAQVNTIRGQQFSAAYHGGRDYIPEEQTVLVQKGERVVSPKQNVELTAAAEKINKGQFGGGNVYLTVQNTYEISDTSEGGIERLEAIQTQAEKRIEAMLVNQLRTGQGAFYNAVRAA